MSAIWMRTRAELRGRWRPTVLIVILIGLAGGVALTAAAGARRTETAYPRFLAATRTEDFLVSAAQSGSGLYSDIARLPEVERSGIVDGLPLFFTPAPRRVDGSVQTVASADGKAGYSIERLHMLSGRAPNPDRPFEAAASLTFAKKYHLNPGDHVHLIQVNTNTGTPVFGPGGKPVTYTILITGVEVSFDEIIPIAPQDSLPQLFTTPALAQRFPNKADLNYDGVLVQLKPGADPSRFRRDVQQLGKRHPEAHGFYFADERDHHARVEHAIRPEAIALAIFALLAALAGVLAVSQVLSRRIFLDALDYPTLRSLGMSRRQLVTIGAIRGGLLALVGGAVAVTVAFLASPLMPIGPARLAEPRPGFEFNASILGLGLAIIVLLLTAIGAFAGWRAAHASANSLGTIELPGAERPSRVAAEASRAGLAPSVVSGVRFALEPGRGRTSVPVRTAMVGMVVAVAAITASLTFGNNLTRLVSTPSQYGRTWNVDLDTGFGGIPRSKIAAAFGGDPDVTAFAGGVYGSMLIDGHQVPTVGIDQLKGSVFPTMLEGRPPTNPDEIVLGRKTLQLIGASVGDTITAKVGGTERRMRIVGQAVFPTMGQGSFNPTGLGEGAATVTKALPPSPFFPAGDYTYVLARFASGVNQPAAISRLRRAVTGAQLCQKDQQCGMRTVQLPAELTTYSSIRTVPLILALLLILIGVAVTAHTLVTSVQRRRRDLATLKTLGFVRRQVLTTVASQASMFALVGLAIGIPLGIAAGRWAWTAFAQQLGVPSSPVVPLLVVGLAVPASLLLANLAAALPGRSAARTQPAVVLRTE
jgi:putative ABC transport system permease protein